MPRRSKNLAAAPLQDPEPALPTPSVLHAVDDPLPPEPGMDADADPLLDSTPPAPQPARISQPPTRARKASNPRVPVPHADLADGETPPKRRTRKSERKAAAPSRGQPSLAPVTKRREILGLVFLALGVLCVMSLWSYHPNDGPWALPKHATQNWVGPAGAMIADGLMGAFGLGAHLLTLGFFALGLRSFSLRPPTPSIPQVVGAVLTLFCGAVISHLALKGTGALPYAPGGLLGALGGDGMSRVFSAPGTAVICGAGFAAGLVLCTDLSLARLVRALVSIGEWAGEAWADFLEVQREKRRLRKEIEAETMERLREKAQQEDQALTEKRAVKEEKRKQSVRIKAEAAVRAEQRVKQKAAEEVHEMVTLPPVGPAIAMGPALSAPPALDVNPTIPELPAKDEAAPVIVVDKDAAPPAQAAPGAEEPRIVEFIPRNKKDVPPVNDAKDERPKPYGTHFELPRLNLLDYKDTEEEVVVDREALNENARVLVRTFKEFGIEGTVKEIRPGPVVTTYEFTPAAGTRVREIAGYADDLAMKLEAMSVRIVAPIPGKNAVGIEIPNAKRQNVFLKEIIAHPDFQRANSKLALALGKDIEGKPFFADLAKMPHLLIAGTTGSGKSVSVNGMILSLLYKATPDEVRMLMIDPKMLELKLYDGIPHLLLPPVTDPKKAALALRWAVEEMERRYQLLADFSVRDIATFNKKMEKLKARAFKQAHADTPVDGETVVVEPAGDEGDTYAADIKAIEKNGGQVPDKLPFIVVVVDEFADLMMVASKDVETYVARLAQKARASGIHVMLATQRPSVDVITGVIKANFPTRISFKVASVHDSKTIINTVGANRLLGNGDMLMIPPGSSDLLRIHGGFVTEDEIARVVSFWKAQGKPQYNEAILKAPEGEGGSEGGSSSDEPYDEFFDQAVDIVARTRKVSISEIQRKLGVGYNRAAKMVERMEKDGLIGPNQGANKPREVFVRAPDEE